MKVNLPKRIFAPGDLIPLDFRLHNEGLLRIRKIKVYLEKKYTVNLGLSNKKKIVSEDSFSLIRCSKNSIISGHSLPIPIRTPETSMLLPNVSYKLVIKVYPSGFYRCAKIKIPIYISWMSLWKNTSLNPPMYDEIEELDLPSYVEAVTRKESK